MQPAIEEATRPIMWNMEALPNTVAMYALLAVSMLVLGAGVLRHAELWLAGEGKHEPDSSLVERFEALLKYGLFQHGTNRDPKAAWGHSLLYAGFLVLLFTTTMVLIEHDFGIKVYHGKFYLAVTLLADLFGLGVIFGCGLLAYRRYVEKPDKLHSRPGDHIVLLVIALLCVQGFLLEGLRIKVSSDPWAAYSPIGYGVAQFFWGISNESARGLHFGVWWFHTITVFIALAMLPYSKFFHIVASSANLFFKDRKRPLGALAFPGDIEAMIENDEEFSLGLGSIKDYSWKQMLDLDACTSCGRCQEVCPAYLSGKPLSPKWLILDSRNHALALGAKGELADNTLLPNALKGFDDSLMRSYIESTGGLERKEDGSYEASGAFRAANELVQNSPNSIGASVDDRIAGDVIDPDVFWACNTCNACVEACPVGINHVDQIVGNRRNMVLMQGEMPSEAQQTLRALETRGNPYGPPEDRIKWAEGLDVNVLTEGDEVEYLYWVGCVSAYDKRKQKIARSMVQILNEAGVSWGTLGNAEGCTGDPARRIGEENLYQTLAKSNIETLKTIKFKTLVANCPHCFNTIQNEYPQLGNLGEGKRPRIIHHSVLLKELIRKGKLTLEEGAEDSVTYHDPCYLGRYNDEYDAPRETLKSNSKLKILEMDKSREKGMCCGAGGGHFWYDMKVGDRVNVLRVDQAAETGAKKIAAACPFCMQMLEDGVKLTEREEQLEVKDIAEFVAENLENSQNT